MWAFLRNKTNRTILSWLGGGLVVAAAGAWAVFLHFSSASPTPGTSGPRVEANCGGVAVGGDVAGSTIQGGTADGADCPPKAE